MSDRDPCVNTPRDPCQLHECCHCMCPCDPDGHDNCAACEAMWAD